MLTQICQNRCVGLHPYSQIELLSQFLSDQCNSVNVFLSSYHCLHVMITHLITIKQTTVEDCVVLYHVLPDNGGSYTYTSNCYCLVVGVCPPPTVHWMDCLPLCC